MVKMKILNMEERELTDSEIVIANMHRDDRKLYEIAMRRVSYIIIHPYRKHAYMVNFSRMNNSQLIKQANLLQLDDIDGQNTT